MINVEETIISQYGESASITQLVRGIDHYLDPRADIELFIEQAWEITTADTWGLDNWGKIVDVPRYVEVPGDGAYYIPNDDYRGYILFKATTNISNCSSQSINTLLTNKFINEGKVYVDDRNDMSIRYVFDFLLSSWELALFANAELIPKGTGVASSIVGGDPNTLFSFFESTTGLGFSTLADPSSGGNFAVLI